MSEGLGKLILSTPYRLDVLCVIVKTALAVVATPLLTYLSLRMTPMTLTTRRDKND